MFDTREIGSATTSPGQTAGEQARSREFNSTIMLESLVCDVQWTCFHAATVCYLVHGSLTSGSELRLSAWRHVLYDNTKISHLGLRYCTEMGIPASAQQALSAFLTAQSKALGVTQNALRGTQIQRSLGQTQLNPLRAPWIDAAQHALRALQQMDNATRSRVPAAYNENSRVLSTFLREAIAGNADRINQWGEITLPTLAQRRQEPRASTGQACHVITSEGPIPALLQNISRHGVGLSCDRSFAMGEMVTIDLADGRQLEGSIVRIHGRSYGLRLRQPIGTTDPLFIGS